MCVYSNRPHRRAVAVVSIAAIIAVLSVPSPAPGVPEDQANSSVADAGAAVELPRKLPTEHLPNAVRVHAGIISGGLPEGEAAFAELQAMGIRTIISVDGAKPDVAMAERHGLRYVHLPHGYHGISSERATDLAQAVTALPGPFYIHCHHGKHRSPAAAAVACVSAGLIPADQAVKVLELAGTNPHYRGLFAAVASAQPLSESTLGAPREFSSVAQIPPVAEAMVHLEHTHERVLQLAANDWQPPAKHPDLDAAHETLLLREHYTELLRTEDVRQHTAEFQQLLREGESLAAELETLLRDWHDGARTSPSPPPPLAATTLTQLTANCKACHTSFRDGSR